jgi:dsDNA-specific endonuclease/ATPase MutS2
MGVFNELKKVLFGASSIAKHGAEKVTESGKEATEKLSKDLEDLSEKAEEKLEQAQQMTEEIGGKILNTSERVGEEVIKRTEGFWEKTKQVAEDVGGEILDKTNPTRTSTTASYTTPEKPMATPPPTTTATTSTDSTDLASDLIDEAFEEAKEEVIPPTPPPIVEQAADSIQEQDSVFERLMNKAEDLSEKLKEQTDDFDVPRETKIGYDNVKGSMLDGQDDFFAKAERFAQGDYHNTGKDPADEVIEEGEIIIQDNPDYKKPVNEGTVKGFEDLDGDGNEIIDDAIILDE